MRTAFIKTVTELAQKDSDVWLVTGDLGFSVFEDFMTRFPDQYLNIGVAEQNLIGASAGLALAGKKVFAYSITTFATMRPYEQIRDDICYQNLPVTIIGGGSAFSYSTLGCTHFPMEDLAIMRALPRMTVAAPGDPQEVAALLKGMYTLDGPSYMRIAKKGEPVMHTEHDTLTLGKASRLREGTDVTIISTGRSLPAACAAADQLQKEGITARVLSLHTLKPLDESAILQAAKETAGIVTCEEHQLIGGLASAVAETLARHAVSTRLLSLGIPDEFPTGVGSQEYFLAQYGLDTAGIARAARSIHERS
jgi:transketolase